MEDPEALRRRLYAPGAVAADVAAYREVEPAPRRGRRRPRAVLIAAVALVLVGGGVVALLLPRGPDVPAARPVALSGEDRAELRSNLEAGGAAGIAAYLVTHPSPPGLRDATAFVTQELQGTGPADRRIAVEDAPASGRVTVLLVTAASGRAGWATEPGDLRRTQDLPPGTLTATTVRFARGDRPVRLQVDVGAGVRWGAAVVLSD